jgi:4-azaleucine resistance transporter AzlC
VADEKPARHAAAEGALRALGLATGLAPLGLLFGAAAASAGFSPLAAVLLSALVFAGGAQFAAVGLAGTGAAVLAIVLLVAVINSRYFLLSAAALDLARPAAPTRLQRVLLALGVVDESYALQAAWAKGRRVAVQGLLAVSATLWAVWVLSTLAGAYVGRLVPDLVPFGLDYILPGIFVGLLGIFADTRPRLLAGIAALAVAGALAFFGFGTLAVLLVPPLLAFALGRWGPR